MLQLVHSTWLLGMALPMLNTASGYLPLELDYFNNMLGGGGGGGGGRSARVPYNAQLA